MFILNRVVLVIISLKQMIVYVGIAADNDLIAIPERLLQYLVDHVCGLLQVPLLCLRFLGEHMGKQNSHLF